MSLSLFLIAATLSHGQPDPLAEARIALAAGRLDQADTMLRAAAADGADRETLQSLAADLAFARGDHARAFAFFHHRLASGSDDPLLLERAALSALRAGRPDAEPLLRRACAMPAPSWVVLNACGVLGDRQRRFDEARGFYLRAAMQNPESPAVASNLGWSFMLEGRWDEARAPLERALRADPRHVRATANLAMLDLLQARELPVRAPGEEDGAYARRLNDAGVAAVARGETSRAIAAFTRALEARPVYYERAASNLASLGGIR